MLYTSSMVVLTPGNDKGKCCPFRPFPSRSRPTDNSVPETWFQDLTAADGSVQQSVVFTTVPGVEYTFYHSDNLDAWADVGKTYGLGQEFAAAIAGSGSRPSATRPENPAAALRI